MNNALSAEWIKFSSLRGSWVRVGLVSVVYVLATVMALSLFNSDFGTASESTAGPDRVRVLTSGNILTSLVMVVLGVKVFTDEIKTRSIINSVAAIPDRADLLAAKALLVGVAGVIAALVANLISVTVAVIGLDQKGFSVGLQDDDLVRAVLGGICYLTIAALFGLGIGIIMNSPTSAVAVGITWPLAGEVMVGSMLPDRLAEILPFEAGRALFEAPARDDLPPWEGGAIFLAWTAVLLLVGWQVFERRDLGSS